MSARPAKKIWTIAIAAVAAAAIVLFAADNIESRKPVDFGSMPQQAKDFMLTHYPGETPVLAVREFEDLHKEYKVSFKDGTKVTFDRRGKWTKIESRTREVPAGIVPAEASAYIERNFPDSRIFEIARERNETEMKLDNGIELTFDSRGWELMDIDD